MKKYGFIIVAIFGLLLLKKWVFSPTATSLAKQPLPTEPTKHLDVVVPENVPVVNGSDFSVEIQQQPPVDETQQPPVEPDVNDTEVSPDVPVARAMPVPEKSPIGLEKLVARFADEAEKIAYLDKISFKNPQESFDRGGLLPASSVFGVYRGKIQANKIYNLEVTFGSSREIHVVLNEQGTPSKFGFSRDLDKSARIVQDGEMHSILIDFLKRNLTIDKNMIQIIFTDPSQQRATGNFYMMRHGKYEKIGTLELTRESPLSGSSGFDEPLD